jgi:hypothetical protein
VFREKMFSYLGKIGVCPKKFFDSQNGTLTENFLATEGGGGRRSGAKGGQKWPIDGGPPAVALRHCLYIDITLHDILEDIIFHVIYKITCLPILATVIERIKYSCITAKFRDIN